MCVYVCMLAYMPVCVYVVCFLADAARGGEKGDD